ncbi:hypothetical protein SARC_05920 [Sphaeroforma arctica JP610]|uniref:Uncharacterized protein n=1 Tax=Sphaeroforma arctica JP610 TaxID=667725 RepID=A0A0L0G0N8_9EUKA|nr:hypothetical protein SARC_05920 [Sphaeroforma arctica JP610]KNC81773.1 hypothetical protein SARC_05920 [Sphaeroforma arctica JP610]|eukprot:XP_014155675.1 hypothetical protein SARC_05920 [Sphaeroforma arctica JP610]
MAGTGEEMELEAEVEEHIQSCATSIPIDDQTSFVAKLASMCRTKHPTDIESVSAEVKSLWLKELAVGEAKLLKRGNALRNCVKWSHELENTICGVIVSLMKSIEKREGADAVTMLESVRSLVHFIGACTHLPKWVLKKALGLLSSHADVEVREAAYLIIHSLALTVPFPFFTLCMRGLYWTYVSTCSMLDTCSASLDSYTAEDTEMDTKMKLVKLYDTESRMAMLMKCCTESMAMDPNSAYTCGFVYMRDLAISVSSAMQNIDDHDEWANTADVIAANDRAKEEKRKALARVTSWAHLGQLSLWTHALVGTDNAMTPETRAVLAPLAYPLIQVIVNSMNVIDVADSYRTAPFRLHLTKLLLLIKGGSSGVHVSIGFALAPLVSYGSASIKTMSSREKNSSYVSAKLVKATLGSLAVIPTTWMNSRDCKLAVLEVTLALLTQYVGVVASCVSFPEEALVITHILRQFVNGGGRFSGELNADELESELSQSDKKNRLIKMIRNFLADMEKHMTAVEVIRNRMQTGPRDSNRHIPKASVPSIGAFPIVKVCEEVVKKLVA